MAEAGKPGRSWMQRLALSLWLVPPILLWPLLLPILEPSSIPRVLAEHWGTYLLFLGLPFLLGTFAWAYDQRLPGRS